MFHSFWWIILLLLAKDGTGCTPIRPQPRTSCGCKQEEAKCKRLRMQTGNCQSHFLAAATRITAIRHRANMSQIMTAAAARH